MELFESFKKRRAVRDFAPVPISEETLKRLVYAARRAPTASNAPYRRILVVKDLTTIKLIKQVSPGIRGTPTALMIIFTDMEVARELGNLGNVTSPIDAGAAAENVWLAAVDLGLGACFTKSYSEAGVKEILDIPANCRTEIMVQLGYARDEQPRPATPRAEADSIYLDRYGRRWEA